jgi:hypothetical protein
MRISTANITTIKMKNLLIANLWDNNNSFTWYKRKRARSVFCVNETQSLTSSDDERRLLETKSNNSSFISFFSFRFYFIFFLSFPLFLHTLLALTLLTSLSPAAAKQQCTLSYTWYASRVWWFKVETWVLILILISLYMCCHVFRFY